MATWGDLLGRATDALGAARLPAAAAEARWMVVEATGIERPGAASEPVSRRAADEVDEMVRRRIAGEPLQYVLGSWSFRGLDLFVDHRVLIPRPETEVTAQVAIDEAIRLGGRRGQSDPWAAARTSYRVADLGTGSGAIALALAAELPDAEVWATDLSVDALAVARANVAGAGSASTRVRLTAGDWFAALPEELRGRLRVIVSNPPYVAEREVDALSPEIVHHEPREALVSGPTGLEAVEQIVAEAPAWLEPAGALVVELAPHQAEAATEMAERARFTAIRIERDLAGRERVLAARAAASA